MSERSITPFLTFPGTAQKATDFYIGLFPDSEVIDKKTFTPERHGVSGQVFSIEFKILGERLIAMDMASDQVPDFTWATSLLITCPDEESFHRYYQALSQSGKVILAPKPVAGLKLGAWVTDKFGVTWQLILR